MSESEIMAELRGWFADCGLSTVGRTNADLIRIADREYNGGYPAFLGDIDA